MGLAAPLFLLGALAVALPFWLHRLQTQSSERQPFSSAMLLETTEQQVHVRRQLKYLALLALRIALLLAVALAFAKPFIERPPEALAEPGAGSVLVVVDSSASMARSGVPDQAMSELRRVIAEAPDGATIAVLRAASGVEEVVAPGSDRAALRAGLVPPEISAARVDFGQLMAAVESYAEALPPPVRLQLISDFQASAMPAQFADVVPQGIASFLPRVVGTGDPVNWTVDAVRLTGDAVEVDTSNQGMPDRTADVEFRLRDQLIDIQSVTGQGRHAVSFELPAFEPGDNPIEIRLTTDDDLELDNRYFTVVRNDPPLPVPVITRNPRGLPVTYLTAALEAVPEQRFGVEVLVPGDFDPRVLSRYSWAIVDDLGSIDPGLDSVLSEYLEQGGNLLAFAGESVSGREVLPVSGRRIAPADLGSGIDAFREIGRLDDQHPALANTDGWHRVRVSRSIRLAEGDDQEVLATLDNGAPFIVEEAHGAGRLLLVLSGVDNRWNDLPVHAVFVGFMIEAADYLSGRAAEFGAYTAGESLSLGSSGAGQVVDPDGESLLSLAATAEARSIRLEKAGVYAVYTADDESLVAVNVDARESDLTQLGQDVLDRWRDAVFTTTDGGVAGSGETAGNEPLALWPWLLLVVAVLVIAESALGNVHIATRMRAT